MGKGGGGDGGEAAAAANRESARDATYADRANQYNPFGSVTYGQEKYIDPGTNESVTRWNQTQNLSPELQNIYNQVTSTYGGRGELAAGMMGRVRQDVSTPADFDQFGDPIQMEYDPTQIRQSAEDAAYQREAMRLDPRFAQEFEAMEIKLRNQGLRPGDQAWDSSMESLGTTKNDAYERARLGATQIGMGEANQLWNQQLQGNQLANALRQQQVQEYVDKRGFNLAELQSVDPTGDINKTIEALGAA